MRTLFIITVNFLRLTFQKKLNYFVFFLAPIASFLLFTLLFGTTVTSGISIGYVNKDSGTMGNDLIVYLENTNKNRIIPIQENKLEKEIIDGAVAISFVIPENFSIRLLQAENPEILLTSLQEEAAARFIEDRINFFIRSVLNLQKLSGKDDTLFNTLYNSFLSRPYSIIMREVHDTETQKRSGTISFGFFIFLILMQATIITSLILKDKQNRTYFRIRLSPVREIEYSLGNMLAAFLIIGTQIIVTLFIMEYIVNIDIGFTLFSTLPVLLAFSIASIGFGIMITALAGSTMQAALITNLTIIPSSMLSGCFWPRELMPESINYFSGIFPQSWAIRAIEGLQNSDPISSIGFTILLLLAFGGLFITIYIYNIKHTKGVRRIV